MERTDTVSVVITFGSGFVELQAGARVDHIVALLCPPVRMELVFASKESALVIQHHDVFNKVREEAVISRGGDDRRCDSAMGWTLSLVCNSAL